MRIIDENGTEVQDIDFNLGYYVTETIFIKHHPAQEYVPEVFHYEVIAEYPNGGKDIEKIIDVPGQPAIEAWDEYEDILRWHWFTEEEIEAKQKYEDAKTALEILGVTE